MITLAPAAHVHLRPSLPTKWRRLRAQKRGRRRPAANQNTAVRRPANEKRAPACCWGGGGAVVVARFEFSRRSMSGITAGRPGVRRLRLRSLRLWDSPVAGTLVLEFSEPRQFCLIDFSIKKLASRGRASRLSVWIHLGRRSEGLLARPRPPASPSLSGCPRPCTDRAGHPRTGR